MNKTVDRRARIAVAALFLTNGAIFANMLPRYPEIKADLGLSNAGFGLAVAAFSAGALLSGLTAGVLIRRIGSARVAVVATLILASFVLIAGLAPTAVVFGLALFVAGAADAVTDVAQNAHGLRVQRNYGRSIINSLHAVWSVGAILGGLMGAAAIALHVSRGAQLTTSGLLFGITCLISYRFLLPGLDHDEPDLPNEPTGGRSRGRTATYALLGTLTLLAIAGAVVEDAGSSWATIYLRDNLGAPAALAAFGYIALVGFQFIGRILGDRLVDRFGERTVTAAGGVLTAAGMGVALAFPSVPGTIAGFAAAGLGAATVIPAAFHAADNVPGLRPGTGLTFVTWLMRVGFLCSPAIVGSVADATSLRVGLLVVPVAGLTMLAFARVLSVRRR
jgi:MFS family permease